jgi:hypothetical protein
LIRDIEQLLCDADWCVGARASFRLNRGSRAKASTGRHFDKGVGELTYVTREE